MIDVLIAIGLAVVIVAAMFTVGYWWSQWTRPKCPDCSHKTFENIDGDVFYDPAPGWSLYHCEHCGADYVYEDKKWTKRADWNDPDGEKWWKELLESRESENRLTAAQNAAQNSENGQT